MVDQQWWKDLWARRGPTWVDSIWDTIYGQWEARDFVGVVVKPVSALVRWLGSALKFGVPIWVWFPAPGCYRMADRGFLMKPWEPTREQVARSRSAAMTGFLNPQAEPTATPSPSDFPNDPSPEPRINPTPESPADLPSEPLVPAKSISPPATIPENTCWYESWEEFFRKRKEDDRIRLEAASEADKTVWKSQEQSAKKFRHPGKGGPRVHIWESCESGGFFRTQLTWFEVSRDWHSFYEQALIFNPQRNVWDYCTFVWEPAVKDGPPDDLDDNNDNDLHVMEHWYVEPDPPANLPQDYPLPSQFLYCRYGFLSTEPTAPPRHILIPNKPSAYQIVGLEPDSPGEPLEHLYSFLTDILQG